MVLLGSENAPESCTVRVTAFLQKQQQQMLFLQFSCSHCSESSPTALGAWAKEGSCFIFFSYCLHPGVIKPWAELLNLNSAVLGCCRWQENMSRTSENLELCSSTFIWCVYKSPRHHRGQSQSMHSVCGRRILIPSHSGDCIK